jgi:hypothetical protein
VIDAYRGVAESPTRTCEDASRIVDESREMDFIRKALEDKGLDPIWAKLFAAFGVLMYTRGRRSVPSPRRRRHEVIAKEHAIGRNS